MARKEEEGEAPPPVEEEEEGEAAAVEVPKQLADIQKTLLRNVVAAGKLEVTVHEDLSGTWRFGLGGSLWGTAKLITAFFSDTTFFPDMWSGTRVLELGAGTGCGT